MNVEALTRLAIGAASSAALRRLVLATGHTNPVGSANSKTSTPSTYRPVGPTCPTSCPQFPVPGQKNTCLAKSGNVALHEKRALPLWQSSIRAAIIAMVDAARWSNPARLHVSGDVYNEAGELDTEYLNALWTAAMVVQRHFKLDVVAWSYTHAPVELFEARRIALKDVGVIFRYSGQQGDWGALVTTDPDPRRRARELGATYCPEQAAADVGRHVTCIDCRLCWERPRSILFRASNGAKPVPDEGHHREGV